MALKVLRQKTKSKVTGAQEYAILTASQRAEVEKIGQIYFDEANSYSDIRNNEMKKINEKANSAVALVNREILEIKQEMDRVRAGYEARLTPYMIGDETRTSIKSSVASGFESQIKQLKDRASQASGMNKTISSVVIKQLEDSARESIVAIPEKITTPERKTTEAEFESQMEKYHSDLYVWELWKNMLFVDMDGDVTKLNRQFEEAKSVLRKNAYQQFDVMYNSKLNELSKIVKETANKNEKLIKEQRSLIDYKKADVDSLVSQELYGLEARVSRINMIKLETERELNKFESQKKLTCEEQTVQKKLKEIIEAYSSALRKIREEESARIQNNAEAQKISLEREYTTFENKKISEVNTLIEEEKILETQVKYARLFLKDMIGD